MKKRVLLLLIAGILLSTGQIEANDCCFFQGFYAGEGIGVGINSTDFTLNAFSQHEEGPPSPAVFNLTSTFEGDVQQEKLWGELFVGWGCLFCERFYVGPRLGVNFSSYDLTAKSTALLSVLVPSPPLISSIDTELTGKIQDIEYTIDGKFGWLLCRKTLIYALVGIAYNKPHFELDSVAQAFDDFDPPDQENLLRIEERLSSSGKKVHLRWGIGLEQILTAHVGAHAQYTYTNYGSLSANGSGQQIIPGTPVLVLDFDTSGKARLSRQTVSVGLSYHF